MGTERVAATRRRLRGAGLLAALLLPGAATAQAPLFLVNGETTVARVELEVEGEEAFPEGRLRDRMALQGPGTLDAIKGALDWIPLVPSPEAVPFDPVVLQKDVVRLRRFYRSSGYPRAEVDYRVRLDTLDNQVDVTLEIAPGAPRRLGGVEVEVPSGSDTTQLSPGALAASLEGRQGTLLGEMELRTLRDRALTWSRERGHPFPRAETWLDTRTDTLSPTVLITLDPGPVATYGEITLEDGIRLDRETVDRQLLFQEGDTFSSRRMNESAQQLLDLELVQVALVELEPDQPRDQDAAVRIRLTEGSPRLISGRGGYADDRGVITEADWSHRDFLGGARTLRVSAVAETGWWALTEVARRRYGGSLSLEQPWVGDPRLSLVGSVSGDHRDGVRETARSVGSDLTLLWERGPQRFFSLRYGVSVRDVLESRGGAGTGTLGVVDFLRRLEETEGATRKTSLGLSGSWGRRDDLTEPDHGWTVGGGVELAGPEGWSDVQYLRTDLSASLLHTLEPGGPRMVLRARAGRLFPLGSSRPGDNPLRSYLRLGDAVFTEGGTQQVRGWEEGALGPKLPDLEIRGTGDSVTAVPTGRYAPLGGLARWGGSVEFQLPLPLLRGRHYALLFLDGARVWTPEGGYLGVNGLPALASDDVTRWGAGAGLSFGTPVGPVRIMVGYKLNPSPLDVRNPAAVGEALLEGTDLRQVPENPWRRWRLHLAIGQVF